MKIRGFSGVFNSTKLRERVIDLLAHWGVKALIALDPEGRHVVGGVDGLAGGDPTRITRVAVRFSKPVFPGQELTTKYWKVSDGTYGFETYNPDGQAVIKNAEIDIA